jgi:hypothetical protein
MENPRLSSSAENTSQKLFIGADKISEILNNLDSDGGSFSELSDSDTCEINSPFTAVAVAVKERKLSSQNLTGAGREHARTFLNVPIQI